MGSGVSEAKKSSFFDIAIPVFLVLAIFIVYGQLIHAGFVNYDDPEYVYDNPHVKAGLTLDGIRWSLTGVVSANWMPLTLWTHMLDCQLFGLDSGMHHLVNVFLHALASLLLFFALRRATRQPLPSAFVAFVFALHPLHVESVAWVAERKDVLSAFFFFLALYAYVRYTESPGAGRYLMVAVPFALGLMAKPMLVTFPFALLLFDVWPLGRMQFPRIVIEKLPLFALSAVASAVTYSVQHSVGAVMIMPLSQRIPNAVISYAAYIGKMFWPTHLAWFYAYPDATPVGQLIVAIAVLLGVSALAIATWRTQPYIITGWCWYLGTLVPVIGLVQVGAQARADRYTYIPMVGLLWILAFGTADLVERWPRWKPVVAVAVFASCSACLVLTWRQAGYWHDSITLYQHAVDVTDDNRWARYNLSGQHYILAGSLMNSGRGSEAIGEFAEALRVRPNYPEAHNNLGILLARTPGRIADAIAQFEAALSQDPKMAQAHRNLGLLLASLPGRSADAIAHLEAAQALQPDPELAQTINRLRAK
jgi:tetratricopeptide (TPR) repeat protein